MNIRKFCRSYLLVFVIAILMIAMITGCQNKSSDNDGNNLNDNAQNTTDENNTTDESNSNTENNDASNDEHTHIEGQFNGNMNDFSANTFDGGTFTQKDFENYDITMVNIWTTWCGYCVAEMPELQELYDKLPDNINMISVCGDATTEEDAAKLIISDNECKFSVLIPDEKLEKSLLNYVTALPTTVFVDNKGNVIGKEHLGLPDNIGKIADAYLRIIDEKLELLNDNH